MCDMIYNMAQSLMQVQKLEQKLWNIFLTLSDMGRVGLRSCRFLGWVVARAPISGFFRLSFCPLPLLASGEVLRVAIGFEAVQSASGAAWQ